MLDVAGEQLRMHRIQGSIHAGSNSDYFLHFNINGF
jgi:hypothetical protein